MCGYLYYRTEYLIFNPRKHWNTLLSDSSFATWWHSAELGASSRFTKFSTDLRYPILFHCWYALLFASNIPPLLLFLHIFCYGTLRPSIHLPTRIYRTIYHQLSHLYPFLTKNQFLLPIKKKCSLIVYTTSWKHFVKDIDCTNFEWWVFRTISYVKTSLWNI